MIFLIFLERNRIESEGELKNAMFAVAAAEVQFERETSPKNKHPKSNLMAKWQFARYQAKKIESSVLTDGQSLIISVSLRYDSVCRKGQGANQSFEQRW